MVEFAPASQEPAPSVGLSALEDNNAPTHTVRPDPPRSSLSSLPGFPKLKDSLLASPTPKQATIEDVFPPTSLDHTSETTPQRQRTGSEDSIKSDEAVFGDTARIIPNQHQKAPVQDIPPQLPQLQVTPAQITLTQDLPNQAQQVEKKVELAKLAIPERIPVFTPAHPKGTPLQLPGMLSPPLTPSPHIKLLGLQKTPAVTPNLFLSPSPAMVVPTLGTPSPIPVTPITPNTPIMPATPIKHQGRIPEVIGQSPNVVANQPPALLPRSPRRPPPPGLVLAPTPAGGSHLGVIGDRRVSKNQPQQKVENSKSKDNALGPASTSNMLDGVRDLGHRDHAESPSSEMGPEPIYVGGKRYYVGRYLGGGAMGHVYSVANRETMLLSALKVIKRKHFDFSMVKDEWSTMKAISEAKVAYARKTEGLRFVQNLLESWYDRDNIYFVMVCSMGFVTSLEINDRSLQLLCAGSLLDRLRAMKFDPLTIRVYASELVR